MPKRTLPNIIICGTPGTGKSTHAAQVIDSVPDLKLLSIGDLVKERGLHTGFDEEWQSHIVDDDALLDSIEPECLAGGCLIDWHECCLFPKSWIDLVVVLRCDHTALWDRLEKRGYELNKIQENNEAEIMQVVLDEARESYDAQIIVELRSDSVDEIDANVERIAQWVQNWRQAREANGSSDGEEPEEG